MNKDKYTIQYKQHLCAFLDKNNASTPAALDEAAKRSFLAAFLADPLAVPPTSDRESLFPSAPLQLAPVGSFDEKETVEQAADRVASVLGCPVRVQVAQSPWPGAGESPFGTPTRSRAAATQYLGKTLKVADAEEVRQMTSTWTTELQREQAALVDAAAALPAWAARAKNIGKGVGPIIEHLVQILERVVAERTSEVATALETAERKDAGMRVAAKGGATPQTRAEVAETRVKDATCAVFHWLTMKRPTEAAPVPSVLAAQWAKVATSGKRARYDEAALAASLAAKRSRLVASQAAAKAKAKAAKKVKEEVTA